MTDNLLLQAGRQHMIQVVAAQIAHQAATRAHYAAVQVATAMMNRNVALLFDADTLLMKLTGEFLSLFGVASAADSLVLTKGGAHIRQHHTRDAEEILSSLLHALTHIKYVSERRNRRGQMERAVIGEHRPDRLLCVPIKFVPSGRATSGKDEAWVPTSFIINLREVRRLLRRGQLRPVIRRPYLA